MLLTELFARAVAQHGERLAVDVPPGTGRPLRQTASYRELADLASGVATALLPVVTAEALVLVLLPRTTPWLYAAQLGVLQAGGAHVCVDPSFPDAHLQHVARDGRVVAVVTDAAGAARFAWPGLPIIEVPLPRSGRGQPASTPRWLGPSSLAYAIYTSGTTGSPKAVLLEHAGVCNLIEQGIARFGLGPGDRIAQGSSAAYDSSIEETWLALASGAAVVVLDDEVVRSGPDLAAWLRREAVTVFCPPPTLLRAMDLGSPRAELPALRLCYVGGEALPTDLADLWGSELWLENGYGPTECTVTVVRGRVHPNTPVTIGLPVPPHRAFVLDEQLQPVADGQPGELCLQGPGLARGYLGQAELTAQRFPTLPGIGRVYRTGDLVVRQPSGELLCQGRIDAQVKVRGHRLELEAVEAVLAGCAGVREVACCLQGEEPQRLLAAHIVPTDAQAPPAIAELAAAVRCQLPEYAVPKHFGTCRELPRSVGGKIDRKRLPVLVGVTAAALASPRAGAVADPVTAELIADIAAVLGIDAALIAEDSDFFAIGGDSLRAAILVSRLRRRGADAVAVRDVYVARTPAALAGQLRRVGAATGGAAAASPAGAVAPIPASTTTDVLLATVVQVVFLSALLLVLSSLAYVIGFAVLPTLLHSFTLTQLLLVAPWLAALGFALWTLASLWLAVVTKEVLIGRYVPMRAPAWGGFHVRHWIVVRLVRLVPWSLLEGTEAKNVALRALGARIGKRVHIHRGVDVLGGGWDLLELGDDVTLAREVRLGLVELDAGLLVLDRVSIEAGATLATRANVGPGVRIGKGAIVRPLAYVRANTHVPAGEVWDQVPAVCVGKAPAAATLDCEGQEIAPWRYSVVMLSARLVWAPLLALPLTAVVWLAAIALDADGPTLVAWLCGQGPLSRPEWCWLAVLFAVLAVPLTLVMGALFLRNSPRVPLGTHARWSWLHLRLQLRTEVIDAASQWLSGTLYWPVWLRCAGMRIGRDCEISTILDVLPEHVRIGGGSFLADGVYLGVPWQHQGRVTVAATELGERTFVGNHVVVPAGERLGGDLLLGVCTVANGATMRSGTGWFGLPAFELPRREVIEVDRAWTHEPGPLRIANRLFWESLRLLLPALPVLLTLWWFDQVAAVHAQGWMTGTVVAAASSLACAALLAGIVLVLKWLLLGRVRPGQHGLWSCWASRWDFHYVVWQRYGRALLQSIEGTLLLPWYLRAMGMRIGRRCLLGDGFAQVVDPDMLTIEDGATVHALFQAHSFEDRVLKIDHVRIGRDATVQCGTVVLYGADIGEGAHVAGNGVVMKREVLLPGRRYAGAPAAPGEMQHASAVAPVPRPESVAAPERRLAFDVARGLAVLGMVFLHFVPEPSETTSAAAAVVGFVVHNLEGIPAALFVLLAGIAWGTLATTGSHGELFLRRAYVWRRAAALVALGVPLWVFAWPNDVLVPMALMLLATAGLLRAGRLAIAATMALLLAVAPVLVTIAADVVAADWHEDGTHVANHGVGLMTLRWYTFDGTYPLLPWLVLPLLGALLAIAGRSDASRWRRHAWLAVPLPLLAIWLHHFALTNAHELGDVAPPMCIEWQPTSVPFLLRNGGFAVALVSLLTWRELRRGLWRWLVPLASIGRLSLTNYLAHIVLVYAPMRLWWPAEDWSIAVGLLATCGYLVVALPLSWWCSRCGRRGPIEALLAYVSGPAR